MYETILINGEWKESTDKDYLDIINPANNQTIGKISNATTSDVNQAIVSAEKAFQIWKEFSIKKRCELLKECSRQLNNNLEQLSTLATKDNGSPYKHMKSYVKRASELFEYFASIWTLNISDALKTAQNLRTGYIWINQAGKIFTGIPFGGVDKSGYGKQICLSNLYDHTYEKSIMIKY